MWRTDIYESRYGCYLCIYCWSVFSFRFLLSLMAMGMMDGDADDYLFAFLIFWPIALITVSVFQLIHFIKRVFKGKY